MMAGIHWLVVFMLMIHDGHVFGFECGDNALGMQNRVIPADRITASSGTAGDQARLNYTNGTSWCAMGNDDNPYLQIDLGTPHIICAVSTQGDHQAEQWVKTFQLNYSNDGKTYLPYREYRNSQQTFYGNVDKSGIVKQILYRGIIARYLRILPMIQHGTACMRAEIYGVRIQSGNLALKKTAKQSSTNYNGSASRAVDGNRDGNWKGRSCTHCKRFHVGEKDWWRVDLGMSVEVEEVSVFTRTHPIWGLRLWNTTFELCIGHDDTYSTSNPRCGGQYGIIPAGSITIVCNPPMNGRYVTIRQLERNKELSLCEVEIYGQANYALNKSTSQSSTYVAFGSSFSVVDGIRGAHDTKSCTSSVDYNEKNPWWMVDLGRIVSVYKVYIITYNDMFENFQIIIGNGTKDQSGVPNRLCGKLHTIKKGMSGEPFYCKPNIMGRYLTIRRKYANPQKRFVLCEVEVYVRALVCTRKAINTSNNRGIPGNRFSASSFFSNTRSAAKARLLGNNSWRPRDNDTNPWLQIDLGEIYYVCAVATQGDPNGDGRTRKYNVKWTLDGLRWEFVKNKHSNTTQIFTGNRDKSSIIKHHFSIPLTAIKIRFYPLEKNVAYAFRVELYGIKKPVPPRPHLIGERKLDPSNELHVDLTCRTDRGLSINWYHNDTDITSYSNGTVRTGSILISTLRVNYTSAEDVYDKYSCGEVNSQRRRCSSLEYLCYVDYGSYRKYLSRGKVTVLLGVPNPPIIEIQNSSRSALIIIMQPNRTADQGNITKYSIEVDGKQKFNTNLSAYNLTDLKPYTNYTVRVKASSRIGDSEWSKLVFTTKQAEPSAAPQNVKATKREDGTFHIFWDEIPEEHANGKILTYEINWKPVNYGRKRRSVVPPSTAANATKPPHTLDALSLNVTYNVSIRGYTVAGPGPSSKPITINEVMETTTSKDGLSLDSSSSSESFLLIIIVAAVISALFLIMIVMIVIIVVRKRHKKKEEKVMRVHYASRASEPNAEGSALMEANDERDEQNQSDKNDIEEATVSGAIYGNLLNREETKGPVPVAQFIEYMRKVGKDENEMLTKEFENMENSQQFPSLVARKLVNKTKNRYGNIVPYDHTRIVLEKVKKDEDSDYINASYIRGFDGRNMSYIASQGPVQKTIVDFWRMIWQEKTSVIIMLTGLIEGQKTKCEKYWPDDCDTYLDISVQLQKTEVFADYSIRSFYLTKTKTNEQRCVFQYHFTAWPDKGVPQYATQLLAFRRRLASETAMGSPWVVHCSAGVGRTGAFLAVDAMLRQAQEKKTIDIFNYVKMMRENRPYMVQTPEQYFFVHTAILEFLTCGITEIRAQQLREQMCKLAEVDQKENLSGYELEFKHLSHVCPPVQDDEITAGNKPCNNRKNRFPNIVPLDKARVFLQVDVEEEGANYINASYANGYRQRHAYILTQAPLDNTITDFWKMIYDNKLGTIVMLNNLHEGDANYPKYWPQEGSEQFGDITVEIIQEEEKNSVTLRTFTLAHKSNGPDGVHEVRHYQHTDWNDGSVPNSVRSVLDLIEKLERSQQQSGNKSIVVQCSDGVGRSGTLCTILSLLDRVKTEQMVDVFQTVKALRISRPGAVETAIQYRFCFELVKSYLDSFSDYSNFND